MPPDPWSGFDGLEDEMERDVGDIRPLGTPLDKFLGGPGFLERSDQEARSPQRTGVPGQRPMVSRRGDDLSRSDFQGISSAKGSRYFAIFRQTFVVRKRGSVSQVELGPWSKQGWERLATNRPPGWRARPTSPIAPSASSMSMSAI